MRKLLAAAVAAATLGALGLTATAQAQSVTRTAAASVSEQVVAGIPASFTVSRTEPSPCTFSTTGLPGSVTAGNSSTVNEGCTVEFEGVWPKAGHPTISLTLTWSGVSATITIGVYVFPEPCENDVVGVGSDTLTPLMDQLSTDWNSTLPARTKCSSKPTTKPYKYSWDAVNPVTGAIGDMIPEKADCPLIARPDGSSAGITQLATFTKSSSGPYCTNFSRSSRPRASTDPPYAKGGVAFVALAGDAVTWSHPAVNTSAPKSLTATQLHNIYTCADTNWDQVGGKNHAIAPFLPQSGSGTLSFFLAAIGVTTPGPCVSTDSNALEENEGVNPVLNNKGGIFIYSVGDWIAQSFHAASCVVKSTCKANSSGVICKKVPGLDQFWCNISGAGTPQGAEVLGQIGGVAPTTGTGTNTVINPKFPATFDRILYNVVPFDPATTDHIPGASSPVGGLDLETEFGATGYDCTSSTAKADIKNYGFVTIADCGSTS
jgi:ABC-type phosphate transport system substrate-binding protein